jgi:hypothetical protein
MSLSRDDRLAQERAERVKRAGIDQKFRKLEATLDELERATARRDVHERSLQILPAVKALISDPDLECHEEAKAAVARMRSGPMRLEPLPGPQHLS